MMNSNCKCEVCMVAKVAKVLLIVGGLNWGLVGVGMLTSHSWNLVNMIFGSMPTLEAVVYVLVGVSAVVKLFGCRCAKCKAACASCATCQSGASN